MQSHSYTRVTLALDIIQRLNQGPFSGYHELNIIKHQIDLHDSISIESASELTITSNDPRVPLDSTNICHKAVEAVKKKFGVEENVRMHIEKRIPVQGGLAGGSANAATVLAMLNRFWELKADTSTLMTLARGLGQDVPFYFLGNTAFDTEATGILEPVSTSLRFAFVLCIPSFGVSTPAAYRSIDYDRIGSDTHKTVSLRNALEVGDRDTALSLMHNDFEAPVFQLYPALKDLKQKLLDAGCLQAVMSGSGSTMLGVASDRSHAQDIAARMDCRCLTACSYAQ